MIHICYAGNNKMFRGILLSLVTVARRTKEPLVINLLTGDFTSIEDRFKPISQKEADFLEKVIKIYNKESRVLRHDMTSEYGKEISGYVNATGHFTPYTLLRLFLDKLPVTETDGRILYLDVDTVCLGDISELYNIDLGDKSIGMVFDNVGKHWINRRYCNAGMIVFNLKKIRGTDKLEKCREMVKNVWMFMPDQSAINKHFKKDICFLPDKYNEQYRSKEDTLIRHYCRILKFFPWPHYIKAKPWDDWDYFHKDRKETVVDEDIKIANQFMQQWKNNHNPTLTPTENRFLI